MIVPVLNRYDLLFRLFRSVDVQLKQTIVIDNGGWLSERNMEDRPLLGKTFLWRMPSNLGVAPSWNMGIKSAPYESGWLLVNSDAWFVPGTLAEMSEQFTSGRLVRTAEDWACVWVGADVVANVGLFSECFVPAYFEDNDYAWRCGLAGVPVEVSGSVRHDNSSTIHSNPTFMQRNDRSFAANSAVFYKRVEGGVSSAGVWDLVRRRKYGWDG